MMRLGVFLVALGLVACGGDASSSTGGAGGSSAGTGGADSGTGGGGGVPAAFVDACSRSCRRGAEACPGVDPSECDPRCQNLGVDFCLAEATVVFDCEASAPLDSFTCVDGELPLHSGPECAAEEAGFDRCFEQLPPTDGPCATYCETIDIAGCPSAQCPDGCQWVTALSADCQALQNAFYTCASSAPDPCGDSVCASEAQRVVDCLSP